MEDRKLIVVGVDGSEDGLRAVKFGARLALKVGANLLLVHAVDDAMLAGAWGVVYDPEVLQNAGVSANEAAAEIARKQGLPEDQLRTEVVLGSAGGVLGRLSEVADLVVVGRHSVSGVERMFVGSTSVSVVAGARCPVVMISAATHPERVGSKKLVGVGLNTSPVNRSALEAAFYSASLLDARLEIVHALQPPIGLFAPKLTPTDLDELIRFTRGGIEAMAQEQAKSYPGVEFEVVVVAASPINELVSRSETYDLLVLGTGAETIPGFGLGGLLRGLMAHSLCPLYITHAK